MRSNAAAFGRVRIIAGAWRGRKLKFSSQQTLRPTPDRVRETLFNWLQYDVAGSCCLDLFAGSGALGFEAASRGARSVTLVENNAAACADMDSNIALLHAEQVTLVHQDGVQFLHGHGTGQFDLVFLDPPYQSDLLVKAAALLEERHWLANRAKIYIEAASGPAVTAPLLPASWQCLKEKVAGQVAYFLYQRGV